MRSMALGVTLLLLVMPCQLPARQAPHQLSEEDLARIRRGVERNKEISVQGAQQAVARRQEDEPRRRQESLASKDHEDSYDDEDEVPQQNVTLNGLDAFTGTRGNEMAKMQPEDVQRQRVLGNVRREAEVVDRQRQRELKRQRLADEHAWPEWQAQQQRQQAIAQRQRHYGRDLASNTNTAVSTVLNLTKSSNLATGLASALFGGLDVNYQNWDTHYVAPVDLPLAETLIRYAMARQVQENVARSKATYFN